MSDKDIDAGIISPDEVVTELPQGIDDPMVLREELAKQTEARRQLTARAKRAEAELKLEREAKIRGEVSETKPEITKTEYTLNDEIVDLRLDGYTKEDVDFIMKNGGSKTLQDKNSYVSIAINTKKQQAKAEAEALKVTDTSGMSEVEKKYTPEMMMAMSKEELAKIIPKI